MNNNVYTDGSCIDNKYGGWGFIFIDNEHNTEWIMSGGEMNTTNNRMELLAIIELLRFIDDDTVYTLHTDSQLTLNCATGKWKRKSNLDLWEQFDDEYKGKCIQWKWVKAHNGDKYNEIIDKIAYSEANRIKHIETSKIKLI
jgi:ribonuclease HI